MRRSRNMLGQRKVNSFSISVLRHGNRLVAVPRGEGGIRELSTTNVPNIITYSMPIYPTLLYSTLLHSHSIVQRHSNTLIKLVKSSRDRQCTVSHIRQKFALLISKKNFADSESARARPVVSGTSTQCRARLLHTIASVPLSPGSSFPSRNLTQCIYAALGHLPFVLRSSTKAG
jgi:hypothetical protein